MLGRAGLYSDAPPTPCVLGYEVAGEVDAIGPGVDALKAGERVIAHTHFGDQAELAVAAVSDTMPAPTDMSTTFPFERAADAHRHLMARGNVGKVLLTPR